MALFLYFFTSFMLFASSPIFCSQAFANNGKITIVAVDEPPNSFINSSGNLSGISIDFVNEIMRRLGKKYTILHYPTARTIRNLHSQPNFVTLSIARSPQRENHLYWISMVVRKPWILYSLKKNKFKLKFFDDAKKYGRVGVQRGGIREKQLYKHGFTNVSPMNSHEQGIRKMMAGRIDFVYADAGVFSIECSQMHISHKKISKFITPYSSDSYIVMSKKGTSPQLAKEWIKAAQEIKKDGTFDKICRKWQRIYLNSYGMLTKIVPGEYLEII